MKVLRLTALIAALGVAMVHAAATHRVLILGDSLTEGYGIPKDKSFPSVLQKQLIAQGRSDITILNAGESGSTTASGPARLKWHLQRHPDILVLALGANDGLRGLPVKTTEKNLADTLDIAKQHHLRVLLAG